LSANFFFFFLSLVGLEAIVNSAFAPNPSLSTPIHIFSSSCSPERPLTERASLPFAVFIMERTVFSSLLRRSNHFFFFYEGSYFPA